MLVMCTSVILRDPYVSSSDSTKKRDHVGNVYFVLGFNLRTQVLTDLLMMLYLYLNLGLRYRHYVIS